MTVFVECKSREGFEDLLTLGKTYKVQAFEGASVLIATDKGDWKWLGNVHFSTPTDY